jgi:hypothetical protein
MKKVSFVVVLVFASTIGVAQTEYKLGKGDITTELQLSLFSTNNKYVFEEDEEETLRYSSDGPLSLSGLRLRYALNEKWAVRMTVGLDFGHKKTQHNYNNDTIRDYASFIIQNGKWAEKNRSTQFLIAPGFEYHFGKWERMSVYLGGEAFFGMETTKGTSESDMQEDYYTMDWSTSQFVHSSTTKTRYSYIEKNCTMESSYYRRYVQNGTMFFGINAVMGMDFYVYKGLYLGAELGLDYQNAVALKGSVKGEEYENEILINKVDIKLEDKINEGNLALKCNTMIRIGWKF